MRPQPVGADDDRRLVVAWLARRLLVLNSRRPTLGPKQAAALAGVSRDTLRRAYTSGDLVVMRPPRSRLVMISVWRLAEWMVRHERRGKGG